MDVVLVPVWQGHVDHVGQAGNVDAPGCHISGNQEAHIPRLEGLAMMQDQNLCSGLVLRQ